MGINNKISILQLSQEIQEILNQNAGKITKEVKELAKNTTKELTQNTKKDAPTKTGEYKRHITYKKTWETLTSATYTWYVKDPEYRLSHLISNGHKLVVGSGKNNKIPKEIGRTKPNNYLRKNVETAEKRFIKGVKEIVENAN